MVTRQDALDQPLAAVPAEIALPHPRRDHGGAGTEHPVPGVARRELGTEGVPGQLEELDAAGRVALCFHGGMLVIGFAVPAVLVTGIAAPLSQATLAAIGLASVVGAFFMKHSSIGAGIYLPLRARHARQRGWSRRLQMEDSPHGGNLP